MRTFLELFSISGMIETSGMVNVSIGQERRKKNLKNIRQNQNNCKYTCDADHLLLIFNITEG
jgi:hypothetical protein